AFIVSFRPELRSITRVWARILPDKERQVAVQVPRLPCGPFPGPMSDGCTRKHCQRVLRTEVQKALRDHKERLRSRKWNGRAYRISISHVGPPDANAIAAASN